MRRGLLGAAEGVRVQRVRETHIDGSYPDGVETRPDDAAALCAASAHERRRRVYATKVAADEL